VAPEEQKVTLIMQRDHLPTLELGHGREHRLKHSPNCVPQPCHEVVQYQFREMSRRPGVTLQYSGVSDCLYRIEGLKGHTDMRFESSIDVSLKYALGPFGR